MEKCLICNRRLKNKGELSKHINKNHNGTEKYYINILNNKSGKCKICQSPTEFINIWNGYKNICSNKNCLNTYTGLKIKESFLKKYGVSSPGKLDQVKNKISLSNKRKSKEALKKRKKTNLKKYGVENPYQSDAVKEKIKTNNFKKYGNSIPQKTLKIKEKTKNTNFDKYGGPSPQSDPLIFKKSQSTKEKKFKNKNYNNPDKSQKTLYKRTGFRHALQNPGSKEKYKNTSTLKFGVNHPMQNEEIFYKSIKSGFKSRQYKDTDIYYQGSYELDFLEKFYNKIPDISRGPRIEYIINKISHFYFPDFYISEKNLIVEIKSKYWNKKHSEINKIKGLACLNNGYKYILIEDKKYGKFKKYLSQ